MANEILTTTSAYSLTHVNVALQKELLEIGKKRSFARQFATKRPFPAGTGRTIRFLRHKRNDLPDGPLTEAVDPSNTSSEIETLEATASQYGIVQTLSDRNQYESAIDLIRSHLQLMADSVFEKDEQIIQDTLVSGTNVKFPGTVTTRATITDSDTMSTTEVYKCLALLDNGDNIAGGAPKFGGKYKSIIHSRLMLDLRRDADFKSFAINQPSAADRLVGDQFEVVDWAGVTFYVSNWMHEFENAGAAPALASPVTGGSTLTADTYFVTVVGKKKKRQFEEVIYDEDSETTIAGDSLDVTMPSDTDKVYNVYVGTATGVTYLQAENQAAGATFQLTSDPVTTTRTAPPQPGAGLTGKVYPAYFFGMGAYGVSDLTGKTSAPTPRVIDGASHSNPLNLRTKLSVKWDMLSLVLNDNFLVRVEATSSLL